MLKNYFKLTWKVLMRRKFFTAVSLFAISFTLIVLMVATAILDHVFGANSPDKNTDRTLGVYTVRVSGENNSSSGFAGYGFLDRYVRTLPNVESVSIFTVTQSVFSYQDGIKRKIFFKRTDGQFWNSYDFEFIEGNPFTADDDKNVNFVAVINQSIAKQVFRDQSAIGKIIELDGQNFKVIGVVKDVPFLRFIPFSEVWAPNSTIKGESYKKEIRGSFMALVTANSSSDLDEIKTEYATRLTQVEFPDVKQYNKIEGGIETTFQAFSKMFTNTYDQDNSTLMLNILFIFAFVFMLLPTINLVNINVSRIKERASEIGVRKSFGASSFQLVIQFISENIIITFIGSVIGIAGSFITLKLIELAELFPYAEFNLNLRVLSYGIILTLFFGLISGVYPAWKMSRLNPVSALKGMRK